MLWVFKITNDRINFAIISLIFIISLKFTLVWCICVFMNREQYPVITYEPHLFWWNRTFSSTSAVFCSIGSSMHGSLACTLCPLHCADDVATSLDSTMFLNWCVLFPRTRSVDKRCRDYEIRAVRPQASRTPLLQMVEPARRTSSA